MKTAVFYAVALLFLALPVCVESKTTGQTSVQFDGISFFNALDDSTCKSLNSPRYSGSVDPETITDVGASEVTMGQLGPCHDPLYVYPVISEGDQYVSGHRLNFYPAFVLKSGNNILKDGDSVCVGDTLQLESNMTGDYFDDGGDNDCPPITFVSAARMEEVLNKYLQAHKNEVISSSGSGDYPTPDDIANMIDSLTPSMQGDITDPLSGTKAYSEMGVRDCVPLIYASIMCTPNLVSSTDSTTITPTKAGPMEIKASYSPQCVMLNSKSYSILGGYYGSPGVGEKDHNRVFIQPNGWTYQKGSLAALPAYKNAETSWLNYLGKNANIEVSMTINVVETMEKPKIELLNSSIGENDGKYVIRGVLKNTGNAKALIDKIKLNLRSYNVLYAPSALDIGAQSDFLAETDINSIMSLTAPLTLEVQYRSDKLGCLKDRQLKDTFVIDDISVLKPVKVEQTYSMEVTGSCSNKYYSCSDQKVSDFLFVGYKCYNKDPYYDPSMERALFTYEMPQLPAGKTVSSAVLSLDVSDMTFSQDLEIYSAKDWNAVSCIAGGDICTQPYCPECAELHSAGENKAGSVKVSSPGKYTIDVTGALRSAVTGQKIAFQARGSEEDRWNSEGQASCKLADQWEKYDLKLQSAPNLVLLYN